MGLARFSTCRLATMTSPKWEKWINPYMDEACAQDRSAKALCFSCLSFSSKTANNEKDAYRENGGYKIQL